MESCLHYAETDGIIYCAILHGEESEEWKSVYVFDVPQYDGWGTDISEQRERGWTVEERTDDFFAEGVAQFLESEGRGMYTRDDLREDYPFLVDAIK